MNIKRPLLYLFVLLPLAILLLPACHHGNQSAREQQKPIEKDLAKKVAKLKASMVSYMQTAQPSYNMDDIDSCVMILNLYLGEIRASNNKETGMKIVRTAVMRLNKLNGKTQETLIETGEREQIAEIIILASNRKGYNKMDEDITEEWREW